MRILENIVKEIQSVGFPLIWFWKPIVSCDSTATFNFHFDKEEESVLCELKLVHVLVIHSNLSSELNNVFLPLFGDVTLIAAWKTNESGLFTRPCSTKSLMAELTPCSSPVQKMYSAISRGVSLLDVISLINSLFSGCPRLSSPLSSLFCSVLTFRSAARPQPNLCSSATSSSTCKLHSFSFHDVWC